MNFENPATDYTSGNLLHNDSCITKIFGPLQARRRRLRHGSDDARQWGWNSARCKRIEVYDVGPILAYTLGAKTHAPVTVVAKWYHEFGAENTFEGDTVVGSASFKF